MANQLPQRQPPGLIRKAKPGAEEIASAVSIEIAKLSRRMSLIENRTDNLQDHLDLIDQNVIEKHKSAISDIRDLQAEVRTVQSQLHEMSDLLKRAVSRMSEFANRDDLRVIERYMNYWSPLSFTTKNEVKGMIQTATGKVLQNGEAHAEISKLVAAQMENQTPAVNHEQVVGLIKSNLPEEKPHFTKKDIKDILHLELSKFKAPKASSKEDIEKTVSKLLKSAKFEVKDTDIESIVKAQLAGVKLEKSAGISKKDVAALVKSEISKIKLPTSQAKSSDLAKKDVEEIIRKALGDAPKGGLSYDDVKKITRQQMEDMFGKF